MAAGTYDIVIDQGSDFAIEIQVSQDDVNTNLATHTARAQLRPTPTSSTLTATSSDLHTYWRVAAILESNIWSMLVAQVFMAQTQRCHFRYTRMSIIH